MMFLMATHPKCTLTSKANALRGQDSILNLIFSYFIPKNCNVRNSYCDFVQCAYPLCEYSICKEHGTGKVSSFDYYDYKVSFCIESGCNRYYCWHHDSSETLYSCRLCKNSSNAQVFTLGMRCTRGDGCFLLCPFHKPVKCQGIIEDSSEDEFEFEETITKGEVCGFECCSSCLANHKCGDDFKYY